MSSSAAQKATEIASPTLPHYAGLTWRLDVPRASRASAASPQPANNHQPVYNLRLSLAHVEPTAFAVSPPLQQQQQQQNSDGSGAGEEDTQSVSNALAAKARLEDVAFSATPDTLLALADAVEAAVKQSEQAPYRRILRLIR